MVGKDLIMATLFGSGGGSSGSGGAAGVSPKEVNFYDYDGTCVHAYTVAEAQALSELPAGPEHPGLVFQGWNWSLEGVKGLTRAMNIGAMYTTDDGTTRLYITLQEGRTSPKLGVGVNGTVTVDWGDGTEPDVLTGTSAGTTRWTPNHAYAAPGDYVIRLTVDGTMRIIGVSTTSMYSNILRHATGDDSRNTGYLKTLKRVEFGGGTIELSQYAFSNCGGLEYIAISKSVIPSWGQALFRYCDSLKYCVIPEDVTRLDSSALGNCMLITGVAMPSSFAEIGAGVFAYCNFITTFTVPGSVTSIGANAFGSCTNMTYYDFTACTAVPALANTSAFTGIPADCEIRVPAALYDEWIAATNWATYAGYIKAY